MAYTTKFTCDRCGTSAVDDQKFLFKVGITLPEEYSSYSSRQEVKNADWCRQCLVACGLKFSQKAESAPEVKPTFEDIIRDIVREEIQNQ